MINLVDEELFFDGQVAAESKVQEGWFDSSGNHWACCFSDPCGKVPAKQAECIGLQNAVNCGCIVVNGNSYYRDAR